MNSLLFSSHFIGSQLLCFAESPHLLSPRKLVEKSAVQRGHADGADSDVQQHVFEEPPVSAHKTREHLSCSRKSSAQVKIGGKVNIVKLCLKNILNRLDGRL